MTRKDYVAITEAFAETHPHESIGQPHYNIQLAQWRHDMHKIAAVLAADNPRFDRERFYRACEGGE